MVDGMAHRPLGAEARWQAQAQAKRLAQLQAMGQDELQTLVGEMTSATRLPRLRYHFQRQGHGFEAGTKETYEQFFLGHIRQESLRLFTVLSRIGERKMWYLVDVDSGAIALYNETRGRHWSFFHHPDIDRLLAETHGSWVELIRDADRWVAESW